MKIRRFKETKIRRVKELSMKTCIRSSAETTRVLYNHKELYFDKDFPFKIKDKHSFVEYNYGVDYFYRENLKAVYNNSLDQLDKILLNKNKEEELSLIYKRIKTIPEFNKVLFIISKPDIPN